MLKDSNLSSGDKLFVVYDFDRILGFDLLNLEIPKQNDEADLEPEIKELIDLRNKARSDKNWERADELRDILLNKGFTITDTPSGAVWSINV